MQDTLHQLKTVSSYDELIQILRNISQSQPANLGRTSFVVTARGDEVETAFKVVESSNLIASNTLDGRINPLFPQELQPRDRTRKSSVLQVASMANKLRPAQLADSGLSSHGAPIVGSDMVVESGNGRTMAISKAYAEGKADTYKTYLVKNADMYGLKAEDIERMNQPVLVRVRKTQVNRAEFAKDSNLSDLSEMAASEKAWVDAENIDKNMMAVFEPDSSGNLLARSNQQFVMAFMRSLGDAATAGMLTADGRPTKQLIDRMQNAIFAKAYKNYKLIKLVAEEPDPEIRNVLTALNTAAPEFVEMQYLSGEIHQQASTAIADAADTLDKQAMRALVDATGLVRQAKDSGQSVQELISQLGLFGDISEQAQQLALFIANNNRSAKRMGTAFSLLAKEINTELRRSGSAMGDMFGGGEVTLDDVIRSVDRQLDLEIAGAQQSMFESAGQASGDPFKTAMLYAIKGAESHEELAQVLGALTDSHEAKERLVFALQTSPRQSVVGKAIVKRAGGALKHGLLTGDHDQVKQAIADVNRILGIAPELSEDTHYAGVLGHEVISEGLGYYVNPSNANRILKTLEKKGLAELGIMYGKLDKPELSDKERFQITSKIGRTLSQLSGKTRISTYGITALNMIAKLFNIPGGIESIFQAYEQKGINIPQLNDSAGAVELNRVMDVGRKVESEPVSNLNRFSDSQARAQAKGIPLTTFTKKDAKIIEDELTRIFKVVGIKPSLLEEVTQSGRRAFASSKTGVISLPKGNVQGNPQSLWHEFGHHVEYAYPRIKAAAVAFLKKRAEGCQVKPLSSVMAYAYYSSKEIAVIDGFTNHYSSKVYLNDASDMRLAMGSGIKNLKLRSTEIISMGFQYLYDEMYNGKQDAFGKDTEFRTFILGILKMLGEGEYENLGF